MAGVNELLGLVFATLKAPDYLLNFRFAAVGFKFRHRSSKKKTARIRVGGYGRSFSFSNYTTETSGSRPLESNLPSVGGVYWLSPRVGGESGRPAGRAGLSLKI
jgi:hypothetical protein